MDAFDKCLENIALVEADRTDGVLLVQFGYVSLLRRVMYELICISSS